jgi:hypothetical protein
MRRDQSFTIRFIALTDLDAPFIPGYPDIPTDLRSRRGIRLAVFDLGGYSGIKNYVAIPTREADEDFMIADARAALHEMLSSLAEVSQKWKQAPQEDGGTP